MSAPYLEDADCTLWHGDVFDVLSEMPSESVDCVVTSPPYWGLRDYGTGAWEGGDEGCDHDGSLRAKAVARVGVEGFSAARESQLSAASASESKNGCPSCGARRVDAQLGLEATPEDFILNLVDVFAEVRRVLAPHGTVWCNLGDSYVSDPGKGGSGTPTGRNNRGEGYARGRMAQVRDGKAVHGDILRPYSVEGLAPKNLVGIPWRVAFALQADGWWLRSDIVWSKPNPMPESVTDRPTKSHEYVFLLTKQPRYFFDQEAVREKYGDPSREWWNETATAPGNPDRKDGGGIQSRPAKGPDGRRKTGVLAGDGSIQHRDGERWPNLTGRNVRSVWSIATQPYPEAHFATYPEELVRRCVLAGCPERVCRTCGKASEREVDVTYEFTQKVHNRTKHQGEQTFGDRSASMGVPANKIATTTGWSDCGHNDWRPGLVLDPFVGSGTTCKVARDHGRHSVGIDLAIVLLYALFVYAWFTS